MIPTFVGRTYAGRQQRGAATIETALVLPLVVLLLLGALQLMLIQHGRIMTQYAAYAAARAGIVHNGHWRVMRNAALLASLPIYRRTDTVADFFSTWAQVTAAAEMTGAVDTGVASLERLAGDLLGISAFEGMAPDVSLVEVAITHPDARAFRTVQRWQSDARDRGAQVDSRSAPLVYPEAGTEMDFDDRAMLAQRPGLDRLAVQVRVLMPLRMPFVNAVIFHAWLASTTLRSGQWQREVALLELLAEHTGLYLLPLSASYAMHLQSNIFADHQREPVWFSREDFE